MDRQSPLFTLFYLLTLLLWAPGTMARPSVVADQSPRGISEPGVIAAGAGAGVGAGAGAGAPGVFSSPEVPRAPRGEDVTMDNNRDTDDDAHQASNDVIPGGGVKAGGWYPHTQALAMSNAIDPDGGGLDYHPLFRGSPDGGVPPDPGVDPLGATHHQDTGPVAPQYMVDLYNKFSNDRYSHPMANIVRSFMNINEDTSEPAESFGNKTRIHRLVFNMTSMSRDEELYLAELRLYTLVEADRNQYLGINRRVSVYQLIQPDPDVMGNEVPDVPEGANGGLRLVSSKEIYGRYSGWETFVVSEAVVSWIEQSTASSSQVLEVRIDSVRADDGGVDGVGGGVDIDIKTQPHDENEPLLVVFSNDLKKRKLETKELHEIIHHELDSLLEGEEDLPEYNEIGDYEEGDYYSYDAYDDYDLGNRIQKRDVSRRRHADDTTNGDPDDDNELLNSSRSPYDLSSWSRHQNATRRQLLEALYRRILDVSPDAAQIIQQHLDENEAELSRDSTSDKPGKRTKRSKNRSKSRRTRNKSKRICKRKRMYVDFEDINWHTWVIAPKGYHAHQCGGRCYAPLSDHLTPTKHAIIQTLLHHMEPHKTPRACCVPTKLDPISILYIDERNVVTYKYRYEGMVVAECGCR